jgi:hypothetical protein
MPLVTAEERLLERDVFLMAETDVLTEPVWVEPSAGAFSGVLCSLDSAEFWIMVPGLAWHPSTTNADFPDVADWPTKE